MTKKLSYPFSYGDELTSEMACKNRKAMYVYSVFTYNISICILGFEKQTQFSYRNQNIPKTEIIRLVQRPHSVNSISRGGELDKSGPGPRAKADARNVRKKRGGSLFAEGFTSQRQYCSRPINKLLSCQNNAKIKEGQFNPNYGDRFDQLSKNPETNQVDRKSRTEAITVLQAENKGLVNNARRPNLKDGDPNLDFVIDGPGLYKYVDVKNPIDPSKYSSAKRKPESFKKNSGKNRRKNYKAEGWIK